MLLISSFCLYLLLAWSICRLCGAMLDDGFGVLEFSVSWWVLVWFDVDFGFVSGFVDFECAASWLGCWAGAFVGLSDVGWVLSVLLVGWGGGLVFPGVLLMRGVL